jgi:hypothetical protein
MKAYALIALVAIVALLVVSCLGQENAEISFNATRQGQPTGCTAELFNAKGVKLQEVSSDPGGVGYIKELVPGTYTLKFKDNRGNYYDAVRTVTVDAGESMPIMVDLDQAQEPGTTP